jgi:hypothetical protein
MIKVIFVKSRTTSPGFLKVTKIPSLNVSGASGVFLKKKIWRLPTGSAEGDDFK